MKNKKLLKSFGIGIAFGLAAFCLFNFVNYSNELGLIKDIKKVESFEKIETETSINFELEKPEKVKLPITIKSEYDTKKQIGHAIVNLKSEDLKKFKLDGLFENVEFYIDNYSQNIIVKKEFLNKLKTNFNLKELEFIKDFKSEYIGIPLSELNSLQYQYPSSVMEIKNHETVNSDMLKVLSKLFKGGKGQFFTINKEDGQYIYQLTLENLIDELGEIYKVTQNNFDNTIPIIKSFAKNHIKEYNEEEFNKAIEEISKALKENTSPLENEMTKSTLENIKKEAGKSNLKATFKVDKNIATTVLELNIDYNNIKGKMTSYTEQKENKDLDVKLPSEYSLISKEKMKELIK